MSQLAREVVLGQTSAVTHPAEFTRVSTSAWTRKLSRGAGEADTAPLIVAASQTTLQSEEFSTPVSIVFSQRVRLGIRASWAVNILLLNVKVVAFILSGSYAVLASAVDSLVDILSQGVLAVAEYQAARWDRRFPIGRTRMAELSVLACACIMFVSTSLVIRESLGSLWEGFHGNLPVLKIDAVLFIVLGTATLLKLALYIYCRALRKNPIMVALSEDHLNDVMSNVAAVAGAAVAGMMPHYWYVDPAVAVLFSLFIVRNWMLICWDQGQKMIGLEAPEELIQEVADVTTTHNAAMQLDRMTTYHHGSHVVVEVEVIMPALMTVRESHDIALELQHKIEAIESVERAFVHVDYARRSLEEHKVERNLKQGVKDVMKPLPGLEPIASSHSWTRRSRGTADEATLPATASGGTSNTPGGDGASTVVVLAPESQSEPGGVAQGASGASGGAGEGPGGSGEGPKSTSASNGANGIGGFAGTGGVGSDIEAPPPQPGAL